MENASKSLIMAAGILIGLLVISLAVYLFADFGATSAKINQQVEEQRIVQFNSQFTSYLNKELTIYEIITILGYAQENNEYYKETLDEQIAVILKTSRGTQNITELNGEEKKELIQLEQTYITNGQLPKYHLTEENIKYNSNTGKVNKITFNN